MKKVTPSLVVCIAAATFAAVMLLIDATDVSPAKAPAPPAAPAGSPAPTAATLTIADMAFGPVTAAPGATVTVHNDDAVSHTATATKGAFDTGNVAAGATASFTAPSAPGTYELVCNIHPSMAGRLVVR
jgi:plastocyanin